MSLLWQGCCCTRPRGRLGLAHFHFQLEVKAESISGGLVLGRPALSECRQGGTPGLGWGCLLADVLGSLLPVQQLRCLKTGLFGRALRGPGSPWERDALPPAAPQPPSRPDCSAPCCSGCRSLARPLGSLTPLWSLRSSLCHPGQKPVLWPSHIPPTRALGGAAVVGTPGQTGLHSSHLCAGCHGGFPSTGWAAASWAGEPTLGGSPTLRKCADGEQRHLPLGTTAGLCPCHRACPG